MTYPNHPASQPYTAASKTGASPFIVALVAAGATSMGFVWVLFMAVVLSDEDGPSPFLALIGFVLFLAAAGSWLGVLITGIRAATRPKNVAAHRPVLTAYAPYTPPAPALAQHLAPPVADTEEDWLQHVPSEPHGSEEDW